MPLDPYSLTPEPPLWVQINRTPRGNKPHVPEFRFSPRQLSALVSARPRSLRLRSHYVPPGSERLVLNDTIVFEGSSLFIRAWLIPASQPGFFHMRVELFSPRSLPRNVQLVLDWGNHKYTLPLVAGMAQFEDITLPSYSRHLGNLPSPRYRLRVEQGSSSKNGNH